MKPIFILQFLVFFIGSLLLSVTISAQKDLSKYYVKNLNLDDGISQCVVTQIVQDEDGFIWIGTFDGLNRYDGYSFKIFRNSPKDSNSIPSSKIFKLFADKQHHLWIKTQNGYSLFDTKTGKKKTTKLLKQYTPTAFAYSAKESDLIWMATVKNSIININTKSLEALSKSAPIPFFMDEEKIIYIEEKNNLLYCASGSGNMFIYNLKTKKWETYRNPFPSFGAQYETVISNNNNTFYLASVSSDLIEFDGRNLQFRESALNNKEMKLVGINDLVNDTKNNTLLISTYGQGIFTYDYNSKVLKQYKQGDAKLNLSANYPQCIAKDKNQVIWIGYDGRGIDVLDPNIKKFTPLVKESVDDKYTLKFIRKIIEDNKGNIWFATAGSGLVQYNTQNEQFTFYNKNELLPLGENFIIEMAQKDNALWLGFNGDGVGIFDLLKNRLTHKFKIGNKNNELSGGSIWSMLPTAKGVWVGTRNNGLNFIQSKQNIKQYTPEQFPIFDENGIRVLSQKNKTEIYLGTEKGLYILNTKTEQFTKVFPLNKKETTYQSIKSIFIDYNNRIWLGTDGSGLVVLNKEYKLIKALSIDNVLSNNVVYGILEDTKQSLWISSNMGLSNINFSEDIFTTNKNPNVFHYDVKNGLQSNEFNTGAYTKLTNGQLAFGGIEGANIFFGNEVSPNNIEPNTIITNFSISNKNYTESVLAPYLENIQLKYTENSFSLNYNTLGFTLPEKTSYQYQLIGYDNDWIEAGSRTYVSYTNLNPGDYEFRVKASNYDGYWGEKYNALKISIATPFYKTIWFYLLAFLSIILIIYFLYRNRIRRIKAKEELKRQYTKEIAEVEMKALRAQINPHFLFNSLNSINSYILKNDNKKARQYLVKFSQLVRSILNNSSKTYINLKEELDTIELYIQIESMRFDNQFSYDILVDEKIDSNKIMLPSLLLQPYIENAIWHGLMHKEGAKHIRIEINKDRLNPNNIIIQIIDNGIGREGAQKYKSKSHGKSFGMQLGASRLKLLQTTNGSKGKVEVIDLSDENNTAKGTKIYITLPILD